jgi:hypothetical protein
MNWYVANTGNHQGLVIEETTGRNVAVAYDKADAPMLAAAPDLLAALEAAEGALSSFVDGNTSPNLKACAAMRDFAQAAIAKARGE